MGSDTSSGVASESRLAVGAGVQVRVGALSTETSADGTYRVCGFTNGKVKVIVDGKRVRGKVQVHDADLIDADFALDGTCVTNEDSDSASDSASASVSDRVSNSTSDSDSVSDSVSNSASVSDSVSDSVSNSDSGSDSVSGSDDDVSEPSSDEDSASGLERRTASELGGQPESALVCENKRLKLECPAGTSIKLVNASYGRSEFDPCPHRARSNLDCHADTSMAIVGEKCEGKRKCTVVAKNKLFGDPCRGTYKYLEVEYVCQPPVMVGTPVTVDGQLAVTDATGRWEVCGLASGPYAVVVGGVLAWSADGLIEGSDSDGNDYEVGSRWPKDTLSSFACEHENLALSCPVGQKLRVMDASYGRSVFDRCPHPKRSDLECHATKSRKIVRKECAGKQSCDIAASNAVFGDPCYGTFKYLEIQYKCRPVARAAAEPVTCIMYLFRQK